MLKPGHIRLPKEQAGEAERAAGYARKQRWKELPGNRYTPEELRAMSGEIADCTVSCARRKRRIMRIA
jgi:hypothetical protein